MKWKEGDRDVRFYSKIKKRKRRAYVDAILRGEIEPPDVNSPEDQRLTADEVRYLGETWDTVARELLKGRE